LIAGAEHLRPKDIARPKGAPNAFDKWQTVAIAIFIALVGYTVMVSFPVLATALVEKADFSEVEVGRIWGADMFGFSVGAILVAWVLTDQLRYREMFLVSGSMAIIALALYVLVSLFVRKHGSGALAGDATAPAG